MELPEVIEDLIYRVRAVCSLQVPEKDCDCEHCQLDRALRAYDEGRSIPHDWEHGFEVRIFYRQCGPKKEWKYCWSVASRKYDSICPERLFLDDMGYVDSYEAALSSVQKCLEETETYKRAMNGEFNNGSKMS